MSGDLYETRWMFGLLDYGHWRVFHNGIELGLVILNSADRTFAFQWFGDVDWRARKDMPRTYRTVSAWVAAHQVEG